MKKIPTLFEREYDGPYMVRITDKVKPGLEWVLAGEGDATVKFDGACCAIIGGELYKRYDAKRGKTHPAGAIPCCEPDPVTWHWPHWVKCREEDPADKWFFEAYRYYVSLQTRIACLHKMTGTASIEVSDGPYEVIGPHFQNNPYHLTRDVLVPHGNVFIYVERSFDGIRTYLRENELEGIVFWKDGAPQCKIKRTDFGFSWPVEKAEDPKNGF